METKAFEFKEIHVSDTIFPQRSAKMWACGVGWQGGGGGGGGEEGPL